MGPPGLPAWQPGGPITLASDIEHEAFHRHSYPSDLLISRQEIDVREI
jgi:hypothetical protein